MEKSIKSIVFSYHKNHQELVRKIYSSFKTDTSPFSTYLYDEINRNIYQSTKEIVDKMQLLICFLTPMYQASGDFQQQIELVQKNGIPIIACRILPNWKPSGWLNKILKEVTVIDLRDLKQKNFQEKINRLREKIIGLLDNQKNDQIKMYSSFDDNLKECSIQFDDPNMFSFIENLNSHTISRKAIKYRLIPTNCQLNLSNKMISNNEYVLIHGNKSFHLFDGNLNYIRSNKLLKLKENDLQDMCVCPHTNNFILLTKMELYLMNPLTNKISLIDNLKLKSGQEQFLSCCYSQEKLYLIKCQEIFNRFYLEEYLLPTFSYRRKFSVADFIGTSLIIENGFSNKTQIQQIFSIRNFQDKLLIVMQISFNCFIYVVRLTDQPIVLTKILLDDKSQITILNSINQWIIFKDYLSNSFLQVSIDFQTDQLSFFQISKSLIESGGKLQSAASFGFANLIFLIDNFLVLYKI